MEVGQLEDSDFTIKVAAIITQYSGATPKEVEQEVIDRIETALQAMPRVLFTNSYTGAGLSAVKVEMQGEYWGDRLPQVSDEGRHPADALR